MKKLMLAFTACAAAAVGFAKTITVTSTADTFPDAAEGSLRAALAAAEDGDTITFDASLAGKTITVVDANKAGGDGSLVIDGKSLTIEGPEGGITIHGQWNGVKSSDAGTRLFYITGSTSTNVFRRITFSHGHGRYWNKFKNDSLGGYYPAGAVFTQGHVRFEDCTLYKNAHSFKNGGVYSPEGGGAVYATKGIEAYDTTFTENELSRGDSYYGVVLIVDGGGVFSNCTFRGNVSDSYGGMISIKGGDLTILDSVFEGNSAGNCAADIYVLQGATTSVFAKNTVFRDSYCRAGTGGGSILFEKPGETRFMTLVNCEFANCSAVGCGGCLRITDPAQLRAINCSFVNPTAKDWGTALDVRDLGYFVNCTFTGAMDCGGQSSSENADVILFKGNAFVNCIEVCNVLHATAADYRVDRGIAIYKSTASPTYICSIANGLKTDRTTPLDLTKDSVFADPFETRNTVQYGGSTASLYKNFDFPVFAADEKGKYRSRVIAPAKGGLLDGTGYPVKANADYTHVCYSADGGTTWTDIYKDASADDSTLALITADQRGVLYRKGKTPIGAATVEPTAGMYLIIR